MARKKQYRIRNWREYNKALVNRGSLTIWFDEESIANWCQTPPTAKRGRPQDYSDTAIICALTLRNLFKLPLRAEKNLCCDKMSAGIFKEQILAPTITPPEYRQLKALSLPNNILTIS